MHEDFKEIARVVAHLHDAICAFNSKTIQDEQPELAQECINQLDNMVNDLKKLIATCDQDNEAGDDLKFAEACMIADYDASATMTEDMVKLAIEQNCPSGYSLYFLKYGLMAQMANSRAHIAIAIDDSPAE